MENSEIEPGPEVLPAGAKITHAYEVSSDVDGISRVIAVMRLERDDTVFEFTTTWPGTPEPMVSHLALTPEGVALLLDALAALDNIEQWPVPQENEDDGHSEKPA